MAGTPTARELDGAALRRPCEVDGLGFRSTAEVPPLQGIVGQPRASESIAFGLGVESAGYNLFVTGPVGTGKRTSLHAQLRELARNRPAPGDWVYVHNFRDPHRPRAIGLPRGKGNRLAADVRRFLQEARRQLTVAFESDDYARRQHEVTQPLEREQQQELDKLREQGRNGGIAVELTPAGLMTVPLRGVHPMTPDEFAQLPDAVRARYQATLDELRPGIQAFMARMRSLQREGRDQLRALEREVAQFAIGHLIDELRDAHSDAPQVGEWITSMVDDMLDNLQLLQAADEPERNPIGLPAALVGAGDPLARYDVNVLVAYEDHDGAPVVVESNPTYPNLFGRIEQHGVFGGGFATDHRMLRAGAVHRANGGYLLLPAQEVLTQPLVWRKLKEVLRNGRIRLENPAEEYALIPTTTLSPEPIELDLKVVLTGSAQLYQVAYAVDEDVRKLFRGLVEFDSQTRWDGEGERGYAEFISAQVHSGGLRHFDAAAVARVIEHGARLAENRAWLSTQFLEIAGLAAEASHWAGRDSSETVSAAHVEQAIEQRSRRSDLIERRLLQMVQEGTLLLDLDGRRVGQINGLAVLQTGDYAFGRPVRITATAGPGRGALVSIEREAELSGQIHDKGFLTLTGYLRERYGAERRIALAATLTFEQSYDRIDGDSAASAELYALLSELSGVPLRQDIAVTGSVNQHGELQAIGGVNEKIEGFYRTCLLAGLTGEQGVIIPEANARHLMLSPEVVEAVAQQRFHVWTADDIDAGLGLLTGEPVGERGEDGRFQSNTVHGRVEQRLERWARIDETEARAETEPKP